MRIDPFFPMPPASALVASICRCGSAEEHARRAISAAAEGERAREADRRARSPDPDYYRIDRVQRVGEHLVMQVRYHSCTKCEYEGLKTMVFLYVPEVEVLRWRRIDPHFRGLRSAASAQAVVEAPSPAARFPGNDAGWNDAIDYAERK